MKNLLLIFLFMLCFGSARSQESSFVYENNMQDSSEHYIFGDTVYVRLSASLQSPVIDTLFAGHEVFLVNKTSVHSMVRGFLAPWVSVRYKKNGVQHDGFIWSGLLSFNPMRRGQTKFIFGFDRRTKHDAQFNGVLKVVENGKLVTQVSYKILDGESLSFIEGKIRPHGGLDHVSYIVSLNFSGEACGVNAYDYSFAWTGQKLVAMPLLTNVGDADVYMHSESFILPKDKGGQSGMLIMDIETLEQTETSNGKDGYLYLQEGEVKYYRWDGKTFTLVRSVPKKKKMV